MSEADIEKFAALKKAKEKSYPIAFWANEKPKCPHCGHDCHIERMEAFHLYDEGVHNLECPECEQSFIVITRVKHTFSTNEQDETS
jgi:hypothetical protein